VPTFWTIIIGNGYTIWATPSFYFKYIAIYCGTMICTKFFLNPSPANYKNRTSFGWCCGGCFHMRNLYHPAPLVHLYFILFWRLFVTLWCWGLYRSRNEAKIWGSAEIFLPWATFHQLFLILFPSANNRFELSCFRFSLSHHLRNYSWGCARSSTKKFCDFVSCLPTRRNNFFSLGWNIIF